MGMSITFFARVLRRGTPPPRRKRRGTSLDKGGLRETRGRMAAMVSRPSFQGGWDPPFPYASLSFSAARAICSAVRSITENLTFTTRSG